MLEAPTLLFPGRLKSPSIVVACEQALFEGLGKKFG